MSVADISSHLGCDDCNKEFSEGEREEGKVEESYIKGKDSRKDEKGIETQLQAG